jgi:hypothetical protein
MGMALVFARVRQVHIAAGLRPALGSHLHPLPSRAASFDTLLRSYSGCLILCGGGH